jgi:hypothetical protein
VLVRELARERWDAEGVWLRDGDAMRPMTEQDRAELRSAFEASGRSLL